MGHGNFKYSPTRTIRLSCFRSAVGGPEKIMLDDYLKIQIKFYVVFRYQISDIYVNNRFYVNKKGAMSP